MTDRYAVIGNPVAHSRSPEIHALFAAATGQDLVYEKLLAPLGGFEAAAADFRAGGGRGANVTVPFKEDAFRHATALTDRARAAGAVNTLVFAADAVHGDNTDGAGLVADLRSIGGDLPGKRILLIGAGGAARGVIAPLLATGPATLVVVNRTPGRASALVAAMNDNSGKLRACAPAEAAAMPFDLVINSTSASLADELPPVTADNFAAGALAYDMVYGKGRTPFLALAASRGAHLADGLGMLVEQAAESFHLWRGVRPGTREVIARLRAGLPAP
jgi:shikimate dehydrogenase